MKRKLAIFFCLLVVLILPVQAREPLIQDLAGLMTADEAAALEARATQLQSDFGMDIVILTTNYIGDRTPEAFADDLFEASYGENGILFLVDMGSRSWHFSTDGTAIDLLSDADLIALEDAVLYKLSNGQYFDCFQAFLNALPPLLEPEPKPDFPGFLLICAVPGGILAAIVLGVMIYFMNSRRPQRSAGDYTVENSWHLRRQQDLYLYSSVTKRAKPKENKSGGSTTHRSSSGRSHGGRGGKF